MLRLWNWFKALFNAGMDKVEDPSIMIDQARRDMQTALVANREKAIQAITQKNRLQGLVDGLQAQVTRNEANAAAALKAGNRDLALQCMRESAANKQQLEAMHASLVQATNVVEQVKEGIKHQEEMTRAKLAEGLALKAQWKQAQITSAITKTMEGLTFDMDMDNGFNAAKDKIANAQSEANARQEMFGTSIAAKTMALHDSMADQQAEADLAALEAKLGMGGSTAPVTTVASASASTAEADLAELEARLKV